MPAEIPLDPLEMIDKAALAKLLGLSLRTINRQIAADELPAPIAVGKRKMWRRARLVTFFQRREQRAAAASPLFRG